MPSGPSPEIDVEIIRASAELSAFAFLESTEPQARKTFQRQNVAETRRRLLSGALLLSDAMAPQANAAAREAMNRLGVDGAIELYQTKSRMDTARLALDGDPIGVEFLGNYLAELDAGGLLAVIGHEIGHSIAHSNHPRFAWAMSISQSAKTPHQRTYAMAAEITADRLGSSRVGTSMPRSVWRCARQQAHVRTASDSIPSRTWISVAPWSTTSSRAMAE